MFSSPDLRFDIFMFFAISDSFSRVFQADVYDVSQPKILHLFLVSPIPMTPTACHCALSVVPWCVAIFCHGKGGRECPAGVPTLPLPPAAFITWSVDLDAPPAARWLVQHSGMKQWNVLRTKISFCRDSLLAELVCCALWDGSWPTLLSGELPVLVSRRP